MKQMTTKSFKVTPKQYDVISQLKNGTQPQNVDGRITRHLVSKGIVKQNKNGFSLTAKATTAQFNVKGASTTQA
jgi:hypothetical protein